MATKTPKQSARTSTRGRAPRGAYVKATRTAAQAAKAAKGATGPSTNGAFATMSREFEAGYPGLEQMMLHWAEGMPPKEWKEQLTWFARDVMSAFTGRG